MNRNPRWIAKFGLILIFCIVISAPAYATPITTVFLTHWNQADFNTVGDKVQVDINYANNTLTVSWLSGNGPTPPSAIGIDQFYFNGKSLPSPQSCSNGSTSYPDCSTTTTTSTNYPSAYVAPVAAVPAHCSNGSADVNSKKCSTGSGPNKVNHPTAYVDATPAIPQSCTNGSTSYPNCTLTTNTTTPHPSAYVAAYTVTSPGWSLQPLHGNQTGHNADGFPLQYVNEMDNPGGKQTSSIVFTFSDDTFDTQFDANSSFAAHVRYDGVPQGTSCSGFVSTQIHDPSTIVNDPACVTPRVPEPSSVLLLGAGIVLLGFAAKRIPGMLRG